MKKIITVACIGLLSAGSALAQDESKLSGYYVGGGLVMIQNYASTEDDPQNIVLVGGYTFGNNIGIEFQYTDSYKKGVQTYSPKNFDGEWLKGFTSLCEYDAQGGVTGCTTDQSINTEALYVTYRSDDMVYAKVKAGLLRAGFKNDMESTNQSGFSGGVGLGVKFGKSSVELEYSGTRSGVGLDLYTLTYLYTF